MPVFHRFSVWVKNKARELFCLQEAFPQPGEQWWRHQARSPEAIIPLAMLCPERLAQPLSSYSFGVLCCGAVIISPGLVLSCPVISLPIWSLLGSSLQQPSSRTLGRVAFLHLCEHKIKCHLCVSRNLSPHHHHFFLKQRSIRENQAAPAPSTIVSPIQQNSQRPGAQFYCFCYLTTRRLATNWHFKYL